MYLSDYLYASGYYASTDTSTQGQHYFGNKNWLYKGYEWMLTPYASAANLVWHVSNGGVHYVGYVINDIAYECSYSPYGSRPTFYLKSSVYVTGGNGSFDNPYTIACDNCTE